MKTKLKLLIVEDEPAIRTGLVDVFVYHGYEVEFASEGHAALAAALKGGYDLILLDVMLPGMDGFEICRRIRAENKEQPIILLTAKNTDEEIIQGLSLGADDYVAKPFSVAQLVLRVEAVLRRCRPLNETPMLMIGPWQIDRLNLVGRNGREEVPFTRREIDILDYLSSHSERPVPREELLENVWGYKNGLDVETRTVDIHIAKLRRKIEPDPKEPSLLLTLRGEGYRLGVFNPGQRSN